MKIGIFVHFEHSFYSNGSPTTAISLADALKKFGHEVVLININGIREWYDDVESIMNLYVRKNFAELKTDEVFDIVIDIDGYVVPKERKRIAKSVVVFVRKPFFLSSSESCVYPRQLPCQNLYDCDMVWTWEHFGSEDAHLLEVLTKKPVIRIPFTWSSKPIEDFGKNHPSWSKLSKDSNEDGWSIHNVDTNSSISSNCTVIMVGIAYAKTHTKVKLLPVNIHNSVHIENEQFFKDNILSHCRRDGLEFKFMGRLRITDFRYIPKSLIILHTRFISFKTVLLDCIWNGIPCIHNSPFIKSLGMGLERSYYPDNSINGICKALEAIDEDYKNMTGIFTPGRFDEIRSMLTKLFDPLQHSKAWEKALQIKSIRREIVVGFSDMYMGFNYQYNFWTVMLNEAGRHLEPPVYVKSVEINEKNISSQKIDVLLFGPFDSSKCSYGSSTCKLIDSSIPKFHITGENSGFIPGVVNFGFQEDGPFSIRFPLWIQYIDWFGANQEKLSNPKVLPIDSVSKPGTVELSKKTKFCAFVVTNPSNKIRNEAFQTLSQYKPVDSAGRLFNNVGSGIFSELGGGGGGELKKVEFLKDYKFSITYENSRAGGYVTEKLLAAKAAGCVPIYWGAPDVNIDFPPECFLNVNNYPVGKELIEAVREIDTNAEKWLSIANTPCVNVDKCRRIISQVACKILESVLNNMQLKSLPELLGGANTKEASEFGRIRGDLVIDTHKTLSVNLDLHAIKNKLTKPNKVHSWNKKVLLVTFATQKYIEPLLKWFTTVTPRLNENISARVYLGKDVDSQNLNLLRSQYPNVEFYKLPEEEIKVQQFPDLWEPQHFAWKLWIYQELVQQAELENTLIWYMDAASMIVRWPNEWFKKTAESGLCMLEDPEQKNDQWCHPIFCSKLGVTKEELGQQQVVGGIMTFIGGAVMPCKVFSEAWVLGQQRAIIVGPKWSGRLLDGRPYGHRHDQSILSILRLRHKVPVHPLYSVYCDESIRRTFKSGACLYIHRGNFKYNENFAPCIGDAHLINLERRGDRIQRFKENHGDWRKKISLRAAYDGLSLQLTPSIAKLFAPNDFKWKKSIAGCALSHLSLWSELAAEHESCENYLILEDDVKFKGDWLATWNEAAKEIPSDYDVLYLGGVLPPNKIMYDSVIEPVNKFWGRIKPNKLFGQTEPIPYFHFCNYSYILSRNAAKKLIDSIMKAGYTTSADHMICNRMDFKHYVLTPLVAGCYQDEDPKYSSSEFNNFDRVDKFDSDLWNNDERFSQEEIQKALETNSPFSITQALEDGRIKSITHVSTNRIFTVGEDRLIKGSLLEYDWLESLFGSLDKQQSLPIDHEPLDNSPIFFCKHPYFNEYIHVFSRYAAAGKPFYAVHLSDEKCSDPIEWYSLCKHVFRNYPRADTKRFNNVTYIPLGPCRSTKLVSDVQKRNLAWTFFGTGWLGREQKMLFLNGIQPNKSVFYTKWADSSQLSASEYSEECLKTIFMPCPVGNNPETFRIYEALEHGCIPIYVREKEDEEFIKMLTSNLPITINDSWEAGARFMIHLFQNTSLLIDYRNKLLTLWNEWKKRITSDVKIKLTL